MLQNSTIYFVQKNKSRNLFGTFWVRRCSQDPQHVLWLNKNVLEFHPKILTQSGAPSNFYNNMHLHFNYRNVSVCKLFLATGKLYILILVIQTCMTFNLLNFCIMTCNIFEHTLFHSIPHSLYTMFLNTKPLHSERPKLYTLIYMYNTNSGISLEFRI